MVISVGDSIRIGSLMIMSSEGREERTSSDIFSGRRIVLFGIPGAFSPSCHRRHLPGFIALSDEIRSRGISGIGCVSVNDIFVMTAWSREVNSGDKITYYADGNGTFTRDLGLELDATGFGMGIRSKRYSMVVNDGIVEILNIEGSAGEVDASSAERLLSQL